MYNTVTVGNSERDCWEKSKLAGVMSRSCIRILFVILGHKEHLKALVNV